MAHAQFARTHKLLPIILLGLGSLLELSLSHHLHLWVVLHTVRRMRGNLRALASWLELCITMVGL